MKTKNVLLVALVTFVLGFILGLLFHAHYYPCKELPVVEVQRDTVVVRDTVRLEVPKPVERLIVRYDTVRVQTPADTVKIPATGLELGQDGELTVAIEQKTYATDDYKAVIEGWRPNLVSMEVYPKTTTITETVTKLKAPRWSVTVGPGIGYDGDKIRPYVGITAGFMLWSK